MLFRSFKKGRISERKGTGKKTNCLICKKEISYGSKNVKRKFCSRNCMRLSSEWARKGLPRYAQRGEKSYQWKNGITPINEKIRKSLEIKLWRKANMERDNFNCQKCKIKGGKLHIHHINNFADFPELRFAIDNGITLSKKAHIEFHKKYGKRNNTREQLEEFLLK